MKTHINNLLLVPALIVGLGSILPGRATAQTFSVIKHFDVGGVPSDSYDPHFDSRRYGSYFNLTLSGSTLYGTTVGGGTFGKGTVFKVNTDGSGYTVIKNFSATFFNSATVYYTNIDGAHPYSGLTLSGSTLYGTAVTGGTFGHGTVFKVNTDGSDYTVITHFTGGAGTAPGAGPRAGVTLDGSTLYGTVPNGSFPNYGSVFKVNTDGSGYTVIKNFTGSDGANPFAPLTLSGTTLYGTTVWGGSGFATSGNGTVFKVNTDGSGYTVLKNFLGSDGRNPTPDLTLSGSTLYGTTASGDGSNFGTVFKVNTDGSDFTVLKYFAGSNGAAAFAGLRISGSTLYGTAVAGGSFDNGIVFKVNTDGGDFTVLKNFSTAYANATTGTYTNSDGFYPFGGLTLSGSTLYGTTFVGGNFGAGTVFKIDLNAPPVARCKNVTVSAGCGISASASINDGSSDPDGDTLTIVQTPAGPYPLGQTTVALTVTDPSGASDTCTDIVTVVQALFAADGIIWHQPLARNGASEDTDPGAGGTLKYRFKLGSTIPIKVHAQGCSADVTANANVTGTVVVFGDTDCDGTLDAGELPIDYNGVGEAGGVMDKIDGHLKYNLDTKKLPQTVKCYILQVTVTDSSTGESRVETVPLQAK